MFRIATGFFLGVLCMTAQGASAADWQAKWIWAARDHYDGYNDTIEARKSFEWPEVSNASLRVTADTFYRVSINGQWVNDGPSRSWPSHYQYDVIDVAKHLKPGKNDIVVWAKFFGVGTFHQVPKEAGLLAQLDATTKDGQTITLATDATWETRDAAEFLRQSPKQSVQMGIFEYCDMRRAGGEWKPAVERYTAGEGPWTNLEPRDCPLLTRIPVNFKALDQTNVVKKSEWQTYIFPTGEWVRDGVNSTNNYVCVTGLFATIVKNDSAITLSVDADGNQVQIDGQRAKDNAFELAPGEHFLAIGLSNAMGHWHQDTELHLKATGAYSLKNALNGSAEDVWSFAPFKGVDFAANDLNWSMMPKEEQADVRGKIALAVSDHLKASTSAESFKSDLGAAARIVSSKDDSSEAVHFLFKDRKPVGPADAVVKNAANVVSGGDVEIAPSPDGDIELVYDLGEQNVGYWQFDLDAEAGLTVDLAAVEYIAKDGRVQHTDRYRNAMRYVCHEGRNQYTAVARRSGRYVFMTLRNQTKPAVLHAFRLIESTYPVQPLGRFACSDERLTKIWEISARTLKLCMEDTFTDCPLYEQTLWVGDARNEAMFAFTAFGAQDLAKRCARLTAHSLDEYPMALCQVPTTWEIVLPAWSFLWERSILDYYQYTGDTEFVREMYPYMIKNLKGAEQFTDARGLFSAPFWNMFDWTGIDDGHKSVLHNSIFAIGAIDAALQCGVAIGAADEAAWLHKYQNKLADGVNGLWDETKKSYIDSVHDDGTLSTKTSQHTSFLGLLYDVVPSKYQVDALNNVLAPPAGMTKVGSPFAVMYAFEALEKQGKQEEILKEIYQYYQPMLDEGATTVWESFASGTTGGGGFPTRSHTHAWSAAPLHFLNRIVLGILPVRTGGTAYLISPFVKGLTGANGASMSVNGPVSVSWEIEGTTLKIQADGPKEAQLIYGANPTHEGLKVIFNGQAVAQ